MFTIFLIILIIILLGFTVYLSYFKPRQNPINRAIELTKQNKFLEAINEYKKLLLI